MTIPAACHHAVLPATSGGYDVWMVNEHEKPVVFFKHYAGRAEAEEMADRLNNLLGHVPRYEPQTD